jgi:thiosulfate/3-mercaptopyruvate sulfurtransferase
MAVVLVGVSDARILPPGQAKNHLAGAFSAVYRLPARPYGTNTPLSGRIVSNLAARALDFGQKVMSPTVFETLIDPLSAIELGDSVKFIDCRASLADPEAGLRAYQAGHIAGAAYLSLDDDLAAPAGDRGRHPLPPPERLAARLKSLGINDTDQVVVYDDAGGAFAARAWWCLRWLGHAAVALLDGGLSAWPAPLSTEPATPEPGDFSIRPSLTRTIDADTLAGALDEYVLVDARTEARFKGDEEPIDPIAGHIPGAVCRPFQANLDPHTSRFLPSEALAARFPTGDNVVCYCGSGVTAAHNILAIRHAGLPEAMLYPGSWSEWIRSDDRPREP